LVLIVRPLNRGESSPEAELLKLMLWILLFVLCWPIAVAALSLWPIVWLLMLPFRLAGIAVNGLFEFLRAAFSLPARLMRGGGNQASPG
jgi:hypothetical protein